MVNILHHHIGLFQPRFRRVGFSVIVQHPHRPFFKPADNPRQGRFSCAVKPKHTRNRTGRYLQLRYIENALFPVRKRKTGKRNIPIEYRRLFGRSTFGCWRPFDRGTVKCRRLSGGGTFKDSFKDLSALTCTDTSRSVFHRLLRTQSFPVQRFRVHLQKFHDWKVLDNPSVFHIDHAVSYLHQIVQAVLGDNDRLSLLLPFPYYRLQIGNGAEIKVGRRLIQDEYGRLHRRRRSTRYFLLFSA